MPEFVLDHPLVADRVARLRDERTDRPQFRSLVADLAGFLAYEACRDLATRAVTVRTPLSDAAGRRVADPGPLVVPVLRAGLGMLDAVLHVLATGDAAPLGLRRDERTLEAVVYCDTVPSDLAGRTVIVCDPMLATGGSLSFACNLAAARGAGTVMALALLAAPEGLARIARDAPHALVAVAAVDDRLDDRGYIVPGLGDAGDRLYGPPAPITGAPPPWSEG
ncbi:MAG TPA: uracil phosphoribosyltransferase [Acidimicrobiales bacterium]|nr:uracil phosphoribosyltransferase [Acidimicrobiales bacterium]